MIQKVEKKRFYKGRVRPTLYFDDLETYTAKSWYYQKYNDTTAYLCSSVQVKLDYLTKSDYEKLQDKTKEPEKYTAGKITKEQIFEGETTLKDYFDYYLSPYYVKKDKLGFHQIHYYHNGKNFDFYFLIKFLKNEYNINWQRNKKTKLKEYETQIIYGSINWSPAYKSFKIWRKIDDNTIVTLEFRDSTYLFAKPVKALGLALNYEKGDLEASTTLAESSGVITDEARKYCLRDSQIVAKTFIRYVPFLPKGTEIPRTVGSWAKQTFLNQKPQQTKKNKFDYIREEVGLDIKSQKEINDFFLIRSIYKGGLSTFNPRYRLQHLKTVYVEDVVSQYPHKMIYDMPYGPMLTFEKMPPNTNNYVIFVSVEYRNIKKKYNTPNYLCISDEYTNYKSEAFYYHHFESLEYVNIFEKLHTFEEKKILKIIGFKKHPSIFTEYINFFINIKNHAAKDSPEREWAKLMLNSLYGKLGERTHREECIFEQTTKYDELITGEFRGNDLGLVKIESFTKGEFTYLHLVSYITSLGRAYLLERALEICKKGGIVYYHDTDSNFFYIDDISKLKHGKNLGDWDFDIKMDTYKHGFIIGSKKYLLYDNIDDNFKDKTHYKIGVAGVSQKDVIIRTYDDFFNNAPYHFLNRVFTKSGVILQDTTKNLISDDVFLDLKEYYENEKWECLYIEKDL